MDNSESIVAASAQRLKQALTWLQSLDLELQSDFLAIAGDASFRRYFRAKLLGQVREIVVVEAGNGQLEDEMRLALSHAGIQLPTIHHLRRYGGILPQQLEIVDRVVALHREAA